MKFLYALLLFCLPLLAQAQNAKIDSLKRELVKTGEDTMKVKTLNQLGIEYILSQSYDSALVKLINAKELSQKLNFTMGVSKSLNNLYVVYKRKNDLPIATKILLESIDFAEKNNLTEIIMKSYHNLGNLYHLQKNDKDAMTYYNKSLILAEKRMDTLATLITYQNIAMVYQDQKNYEYAENYTKKVLELAIKINDFQGIADANSNLGTLSMIMKRDPKFAINFFTNAIKVYIKIGYKNRLALTYNQLGEVYRSIKQFNQAFDAFYLSYYYSAMTGELEIYKATIKSLMKNHTQTHNYDSSVYYFEEYEKVTDSIFTIFRARDSKELTTQYETAKKDAENAKLNLQNAEQQNEITQQYFSMAIIAVILISLASGIWFYFRQKAVNQVREARINTENKANDKIGQDLHDGIANAIFAIQGQLENPKLFEDLAKIRQDVRMMSHQLTAFLGEDMTVKLQTNIDDFQKSYPNIKFSLTTHPKAGWSDLDKELQKDLYRIAQEAVSNAIRYADCSVINVNLIIKENLVELSIADNGKGIGDSAKSLGMISMEERCRYWKGKFDIETGKGTEITATVPIKYQKI